ncbi:MAG: excinuclease ABC subunit UvrC [Candidatus Omnitrophota bacterium]
MKKPDKIKEKFLNAPDSPGVYLMKDASGKVIYVGKAKALRRRLSSYLKAGNSVKTAILMSHVCDIDFQLCPTESFALLQEAALIQKYKPKYNISLRDDKSFPLVKITREEFPAICITRKKEADGSRYFGPYTSAGLLRDALKVIRRHFPYRYCKELPEESRIYHRIGLAPAADTKEINKREYRQVIKNIILLLEGRQGILIKGLLRKMEEKAKKLEFEEAAAIRDQVNALSALSESNVGVSPELELLDFKKLLNLDRVPVHIEAFDISNIAGKEATGSMVSFFRGLPDKNNYRRFRIKTVAGIDDYKMLSEVVRRRYSRALSENLKLPDLILIDGGLAHLTTAQKELKALGLDIPLVSIAKKKENIYTKGSERPIKLKRDTPALNLIRRMRDEAHRFAVSYHHLLRRKKVIGG